MTSPVRLYQREMHSNLGFFPTWFPGDQIEIGDVGALDGGRFRRLASLEELNIPYETTLGSSTQNVQYSSTQGTKIDTHAAVDSVQVAHGEIKLEFSRAGAFVFHANELRLRQLSNRLAVGKDILQAYRKGAWKKEWFLVESHYVASCATVVVSEDSAATLVLNATASGPLAAISLADPKAGLSVARSSGRIVHIVGANDLHPLYACLALRDPVFGHPSIDAVRGQDSAGGHADLLFRPGIGALLES